MTQDRATRKVLARWTQHREGLDFSRLRAILHEYPEHLKASHGTVTADTDVLTRLVDEYQSLTTGVSANIERMAQGPRKLRAQILWDQVGNILELTKDKPSLGCAPAHLKMAFNRLGMLWRELEALLTLGHNKIAYETSAADLIKSLLGVVKRGGVYASPSQAKFLWHTARTFKTPQATSWGREYFEDNPNAYAVSLMAIDSRFGRTDRSKIRYYAYFFVLDGAGVKAMARGKIEHPKGDVTEARLVGAGPTEFVRTQEAPVLYDHHKVEQATQDRIRESQPLIDKIKTISGYGDNDFLRDMVGILERGQKLSPAQLGVVRKYTSDVEVGDANEWATTFKHGMEVIEENLIKPMIRFFESDRAAGLDESAKEWYSRLIKDSWQEFKRKPEINIEVHSHFSTLNGLAEDIGIKHQRGVTGFGDAMARLWVAARRGQKAPRTALKALPAAYKYIEQFERLTPSKVEAALAKDFGKREKIEDPFAPFDM